MMKNILLVCVLTVTALIGVSVALNIKSQNEANSGVSDKQSSHLNARSSADNNNNYNYFIKKLNSTLLRQERVIYRTNRTGLLFGVPYFIKEYNSNYGRILQWDGNINGNLFGLTWANNTIIGGTDSVKFIIEPDGNELFKIRNMETNLYISYSSSYGFILTNSTSYINSIRIVWHASTGYISLKISSSYISYLTSLTSSLGIYTIDSTDTAAMANFKFFRDPDKTIR